MAKRRPPDRVRTALSLSPEASKRLGRVSVEEARTLSEIVETLILRHAPHYVTQLRGSNNRPDSAVEISAPISIPA
jgi:hypothetical protein